MSRLRAASKRQTHRVAPPESPVLFDDLPDSALGHIDTYGYLNESAGWWFVGWMPRPFQGDHAVAVPACADGTQGSHNGQAVISYFERPDLDPSRVGVIVYLGGGRRLGQGLRRLSLQIDGATYGAGLTLSTTRCDDRALYDLVRQTLVFQATESVGRERQRELTARLGYVGADTLHTVAADVALDIDDVIVCPPNGVLLKGWCLAPRADTVAVRLRAGPSTVAIRWNDTVRVARPDVIQALGARYGISQPNVGFIAHLEGAYSEDDAPYLEVDLPNGERAYRGLTLSRKQGIDAIRAVLEGTECRYANVDHIFDGVFGPAVTALNRARLAEPYTLDTVQYGTPVTQPTCTLIIPLYGRIDYLEYQLALLSADLSSRSLDIVYVLDDPSQRREVLTLAETVYHRFRLPFRLLISSANRGFGPASNEGLRAAKAPYVAFVNSDVFPITHGWTDRLIATLKKQPKLGAIGPQLLYEDGSVQHEGCYFQSLPEYGHWTFVEHLNKGRRPADDRGLQTVDMITAACLVMSTKVARELGGFDEQYAIGDFEDADLCRRLSERKLSVAVDTRVQCHHLERQSQARLDGHWRMNLTLFNAWNHQRRWISDTRVGATA